MIRGNPTVNFHGQRRSNVTHQSTTDPQARLAKKGAGKEAKLFYSAHALMENRNTILVDFQVEPADGYAERRAAIAMVDERLAGRRRITLGGDKGYDTRLRRSLPHAYRHSARGLQLGARRWLCARRARCAIRATRSVSGSASASKTPSAG
jgi:hypothetical protein